MKAANAWRLCASSLAVVLLGGCMTKPPMHDYTAFERARPATLLVMPPLNESPDIKATPAVWSHATRPLAEAGYYVLPVALVDETFKQNGITTAHDAQDIPLARLRDFFGADAAMYIKVTKYGTSYHIVSSETRVAVEGRLVDLRSGDLLWQGKAMATSAEQNQSQGGLAGMLVKALIQQIIETATDAAYNYAGIASMRLMAAPRYNGLLAGPRSPHYGRPPPAQ